MKNFAYIYNEYNLNIDSCVWLRKMGLNETRWILDTKWLRFYSDPITFSKWIDQ